MRTVAPAPWSDDGGVVGERSISSVELSERRSRERVPDPRRTSSGSVSMAPAFPEDARRRAFSRIERVG
jgi:hypothetical protein